MEDSSGLVKDIASILRSHGVSLGEAQNVLDKVKSSYSQFSVDLNDREAEHFLVTFKQVLHFAIFAHAPPVPGQVPRSIWLGFGRRSMPRSLSTPLKMRSWIRGW